MHVHDEIREHILYSIGMNRDLCFVKRWNTNHVYRNLTTNHNILRNHPSLDLFRSMSENRMVVGSFRYRMIDDYSLLDNEEGAELVRSAIARIYRYKDTGDIEFLVDAYNLAMIEYYRVFRHREYYNRYGNYSMSEMVTDETFMQDDLTNRIYRMRNIIYYYDRFSFPFAYTGLILFGIFAVMEFCFSDHPNKHIGDGIEIPEDCRVKIQKGLKK